MSNFKVNARTKILRFKEQFNKLVDKVLGIETEIPSDADIKNLIQADKDILSQIVYDEENHTITFPKGVMPLKISDDVDNMFYFNYKTKKLISDDGTILNISFGYDFNKLMIIDENSSIVGPLYNIDFIFTTDDGLDSNLNTYYLYNPITSGGTKLYQHEIYFNGGGTIISPLYVVSTKSTPYEIGENVGLADGSGVLAIRDDDNMVYQYIDFSSSGFTGYTIGGVSKSDTANTITADSITDL